MTPADEPKEGSLISTPPSTREIPVNESVEGIWLDEGFAVFGVDGNPIDPPVLLPKERFEELFEKGGETDASEIEKPAP